MGISVEQDKYNLNCRLPELEVLPACAALGIGFVAWSPLDGGLLTGKGEQTLRRDNNRENYEKYKDKLVAFSKLCGEAGVREADAAQLWLLTRPGVTAPILGVRTLEQLNSCLRVLEMKPDAAFMDALDRIFPGPGGAAPEAYAW